jgi:hypothetical protein
MHQTTRGSAAEGLARFLPLFAKIVTGPESVAAVLLALSDRSAMISPPIQIARPERPIDLLSEAFVQFLCPIPIAENLYSPGSRVPGKN